MLTLLFSLRDCFRARAVLQAEILALRHQLLVLQRSSRPHKLRLGWADRVLWVWLSRLWNDWRSALLIVKPETVVAWHCRGFRLYWNIQEQVLAIYKKRLINASRNYATSKRKGFTFGQADPKRVSAENEECDLTDMSL